MSKKSENVRVAVRCRPLNSGENGRGESSIVSVVSRQASITVDRPSGAGSADGERDSSGNLPSSAAASRTFTFDYTYGADATQHAIFAQTAQPIIDSVLEGYNGTIFCYGQTGTGKTHTMEGVVDDESLRGIMPNSFHYIFDKVAAAHANVKFLVRASFLEIYLDDVYDLLNTDKRKRMEVKESKDKGVFVKDLSEYAVNSVADMVKLLKVGSKQRAVGATKMNAGSSRSHSILSITIETSETIQAPPGSVTETGAPMEDKVAYKVGKLHLVDLAGSERQKKTEAEGSRLDEAKSINWSLTVLGNVIKALIDKNAKHVPYRDSKLTRLLQDSLGGNTKTVMIANVGPAHTNWEETMATLRYADRAKQIQNKPNVNADAKDTMLKEMQDEIGRLKEMLAARQSGGGAPVASVKKSLARMEKKELMKHLDQLPADMIEERVEERLVEQTTGISEDDLAGMKRKAEEERLRLQSEKEKEKRAMTESASQAESAARQQEEELSEKDRLLKEEEEEMARIAAALQEREQSLMQGGEQVELAKQQAEELRRSEEELARKKQRQTELQKELEQAEENELLLATHATSVEEDIKDTSRKIKQLWDKYCQRRDEMGDELQEWEREKAALMQQLQNLADDEQVETLIVNAFVPAVQLQLIESLAAYDEQSDEWMIAGMEYGGGAMGKQHAEEEVKEQDEQDDMDDMDDDERGSRARNKGGKKQYGGGRGGKGGAGGGGRSNAAMFLNYGAQSKGKKTGRAATSRR